MTLPRMIRGCLIVSVVLATLLGGGHESAQAQEGDAAEARGLFRRGVQAFDREEYARALDLFQRSYAARESQLVLYNLAVTERRLGRDEVALTHLYEWMYKNADEATPRRGEVEGVIRELAPRLSTLRFDRTPADSAVFVDGAPLETTGDGVAALRPGVYTLRFDAEGYESQEIEVTLEAGTDERLEVALSEARAGIGEDPTGNQMPPTEPSAEGGGLLFTWIAGGLTLAFAGLAVGSWVAGDAAFADLEDTCSPSCSDDQVSQVNTWDLLTNVGLIGAGVMGALTIVLALVELDVFSGDDDSPEQTVTLGPGSVGYRLRF